MTLRRVDAALELAEVESVASKWSESPHQPAFSEQTRFQLRMGVGTVFRSEDPGGVASLTPTKRADIGMVEVAVPGHVAASTFWDQAEPDLKSEAVKEGYRILDLLTWDAGLRGDLEDRGWQRVRTVNRGTRIAAPVPLSSETRFMVDVFQTEGDTESLLEVNNTAFEGHPEAGDWDHAELENLFREPWFDQAGLFVTRDGSGLTGFCWTKVHTDGVGEIYLLAVKPVHAGHGLGRSLVTTGVDYLSAERGCVETIVYWDPSNRPASSLYRSIGFSVDMVGGVFRHRM